MIRIISAIITTILTLFTALFIRELFFDRSDKPPAPTPPYFIENPRSEYVIVKKDNIYYIPFTLNNVQTFVPIGKSTYDLASLVNKKVILKLDYPKNPQEYPNYLTKQQCIKDICNNIYSKEKYPSYLFTVNIANVMEH